MNSTLRILLIDDNPDDRMLTIRELRREFLDLQVEQVIEAKRFARALERGDFDLVITDYQLRWTDGLAVLRAVKARWPDCPVIMFTATGSEEIAVEAMKNGLEDYVLKSPKHFVRLPAAVRSALERAEDIAARKRAEEELRLHGEIMTNMVEGVILTRVSDGTIVYANPKFEEMFGYGRGQLVGKHISVVNAPTEKSPEEMAKDIQRSLKKTGVWSGEVDNVKKDGTPFWCYANVSTFDHREHGNVWVAVHTDVTERKRAEEELRRYREHLEELVEERTAALDAFAYSVSHEMRAPLRAMQGLVQALVADYIDQLDAVGQDYAGRIAAAAERMDTMIQDLLAYSRLSHADMRLQAADVGDVVQEALSLLEAEIQEKEAQVTVERPLLLQVLGHHATLVQVVENLVSNAVGFVAPDVQPQVRVSAEERGEWVRLWVEDKGIGIAPGHHERIFRIFERLHGIETYPGTGVGLAIVLRGMERMGGRVGVESEVGQGSRFWVELRKVEEKP